MNDDDIDAIIADLENAIDTHNTRIELSRQLAATRTESDSQAPKARERRGDRVATLGSK